MEDQYLDKHDEQIAFDKALAKAKGDAFLDGFFAGGLSMMVVMVVIVAFAALVIGAFSNG